MIHEILALFAQTEVFIYVFIEILVKINITQRILFLTASWKDKIVFVVILGAFSIFGTYVGIPLPSGAITNIRDLGPMIAGLTAGPIIGLAVGLIGGVQRFFIGGFTCVPCSLATVLAGLIAGGIYLLSRKRLVKMHYAVILAVGVEIIHAGLTLAIARPFPDALATIAVATPAMIIANSLGMAIVIIILDRIKPSEVE